MHIRKRYLSQAVCQNKQSLHNTETYAKQKRQTAYPPTSPGFPLAGTTAALVKAKGNQWKFN